MSWFNEAGGPGNLNPTGRADWFVVSATQQRVVMSCGHTLTPSGEVEARWLDFVRKAGQSQYRVTTKSATRVCPACHASARRAQCPPKQEALEQAGRPPGCSSKYTDPSSATHKTHACVRVRGHRGWHSSDKGRFRWPAEEDNLSL